MAKLIHGVFLALVIGLTGGAVEARQAAPQGHTGSVTGRVTDARTGAGLSRVRVLVEDGPSTLSDAEGRFELTGVAPGRGRLYVSVVGYILVQREIEVPAGGRLELAIPLSEGTGTYTETVTVSADVFRVSEPAVAAQQVLGSADLQNLRGVLADDPLRAVQVLPGVATGDDLRSEFTVRGSDFGHMNFTVDGFSTPFLLHTVRAIEDRANTGSVAMINSDILEDVTLLNGGYAQKHGNRTGAEIDFRLRDGSRERRQLRVAASGTNAAAVFEGPIGTGVAKGSWLVSARKSYLDAIVKRLRELRDEGLTFAFSDLQARMVYDLSARQRVELTAIAGASRLEESDPEDADDLFVGRNKSAVAIAGWRITGRRSVVSARLFGGVSEFRNDELDSPNLDDGGDRQVAARTDATFTLARSLQLEAGAQAERTHQTRLRRRATGSTGFRVVNDYSGTAARSGVYAQLRWNPAANVTLIPGARFDRTTLTDQLTGSPWIVGEWRAGAAFTLRGGAGVYRQSPDLEQVIGALGRAANTHERAAHYDVGVEGRLGASTRWQLTLYDREESDFMRRAGVETRLLGGRVVRGSDTARYANRLEGYARGVEVLLQRRTPNGLSGWVSYAYGRNRYRDTLSGETFWGDLDQRHTANVYALYRLSERMSVTGKLRMGSNFPLPGYYSIRNGLYFLSERRNELRLPVYARLDLRANRTFNWSRKRLTLFAEVMNVLNRDNVRFDPPRINVTTRQVTGLFETMIPIVPTAGVLIEF
jgi:hypothetical protein